MDVEHLHRVGELMSKTEAEVSETGDGCKLPFEESLVSSAITENVGHWSGVAAVDRGDPGGAADGVGTVGVWVGEFDWRGVSWCL